MPQQAITISDVAQALGMSKTTVSRAISGKGRVSEETRQKVQDYIQQHNYRPNAVARGLAQSKTYNIALVISSQFSNFDLRFVRKSMTAVCEAASQTEYEVLLTIADQHSSTPLRRLLDKGKVDGALLTSAVEEDPLTDLLRSRDVPFVVMGHLNDKEILQVDNDQVSGCRELTALLLKMGRQRIALLGGAQQYTVNVSRLRGFEEAHAQEGVPVQKELVYMDLESVPSQLAAVEDALTKEPDCLLCMDDSLSLTVLKYLKGRGIRVPQDIQLASMYDSEALEESDPSITAVQFDADKLARTAYQMLLDTINGKSVKNCLELGYQLVIRRSTL